MQLRECVEGSGQYYRWISSWSLLKQIHPGKLCGAVFLDQDFEELMQQMVGEGAWNNISPANVKRMMNNEWENGIKRGFDGSERTWNVTLPYDCATTTSREPVLRLSRCVTFTDKLPILMFGSQRTCPGNIRECDFANPSSCQRPNPECSSERRSMAKGEIYS